MITYDQLTNIHSLCRNIPYKTFICFAQTQHTTHPLVIKCACTIQCIQRLDSLAEAIHDKVGYWIAVDTNRNGGILWYDRWFYQSIQHPITTGLIAVNSMGWITSPITQPHQHLPTKIFIDFNSNVYMPKTRNLSTILQTKVILDDEVIKEMGIDNECIMGFPRLPSTITNQYFATMSGVNGIQALGQLRQKKYLQMVFV